MLHKTLFRVVRVDLLEDKKYFRKRGVALEDA
jgi:hypothetical protein